ncbi:hypothetical protein [Streptomyces sp. NPDC058279]|uniref:hypothetical protein n=1 Tax=Streptomyces sp. NPDC058279 TaxID=3346418 RepID=UPI0036E54480
MIKARFVGGPLDGFMGEQTTKVSVKVHRHGQLIGSYVPGPDGAGAAVYQWHSAAVEGNEPPVEESVDPP